VRFLKWDGEEPIKIAGDVGIMGRAETGCGGDITETVAMFDQYGRRVGTLDAVFECKQCPAAIGF
jgi:hypothetical protein